MSATYKDGRKMLEGAEFMKILDELGIETPDNCRKLSIIAEVNQPVIVQMELLQPNDIRLYTDKKFFKIIST